MSLFPEKRHQGAVVRLYGEASLSGPLFATLSSLRCVSGFPLSRRFRRSVSTPVRQWARRRASFFRSVSTPVDSWPCLPSLRPWGRFRFFFEPSRVSEALCRRQEPREGVPKRARACERGGEARRREPRGRLTTTYRTINARLPPDCERLLIFNFFSLSHSDSSRKTALKVFLRVLSVASSLSGPFSPLCLHSGA